MYNHEFEAYQNKELTKFKCEDVISMNLHKYKIIGVALISTWNGNTSAISMDPIEIDANSVANKEEFIAAITKNLNDGGFGSQDVLGAYIVIDAIYTHDITVGSASICVDDCYINGENYQLSQEEKDFLFETWNEII
jgi:hypothetical protein